MLCGSILRDSIDYRYEIALLSLLAHATILIRTYPPYCTCRKVNSLRSLFKRQEINIFIIFIKEGNFNHVHSLLFMYIILNLVGNVLL